MLPTLFLADIMKPREEATCGEAGWPRAAAAGRGPGHAPADRNPEAVFWEGTGRCVWGQADVFSARWGHGVNHSRCFYAFNLNKVTEHKSEV